MSEFEIGDRVRDKSYRGQGEGTVVMPVGPFRTQVEWDASKLNQIEKNEDIEKAESNGN